MNAGTFIHSTPLLDGSIFENTLIYITEYNGEGAVGFVVNRLFNCTLNELAEFSNSKPFALYDGGPVDREHLFFLHRRPDLIPGGAFVADNIYVGGDFKQAVLMINRTDITARDIKLFVGYCGWDEDELDNEIGEGSWVVLDDGEVF